MCGKCMLNASTGEQIYIQIDDVLNQVPVATRVKTRHRILWYFSLYATLTLP